MNKKGYRDPGGWIYDADTVWYVNWNYQYGTNPYGCYVAGIKTWVDVTFRFPKWDPSSTAPVKLKDEWFRYMEALKAHEDGHKQHGIKAAQEIERAILSMGARNNCDALGAQANALGQRIIKKYEQRDIGYDLQTQHGKTQGATFPKNYLLRKKSLSARPYNKPKLTGQVSL